MSSLFPQGIPELPDAIKDAFSQGEPESILTEVESEMKLVVYTIVAKLPVGLDPLPVNLVMVDNQHQPERDDTLDVVDSNVLDLEDV